MADGRNQTPTAFFGGLVICEDCGKTIDIGEWPFPCAGMGHEPGAFWTGDAAIHASERTVIYRNPQTNETRIPGRADRPIHPKYQAAGFTERVELSNVPEIRRYEKATGKVHEASNYDKGSATAERATNSV